MMTSFLRTLLGLSDEAPEPQNLDPKLVAAAGLLIEAARLDGRVDEVERQRIADLVRTRFQLGSATVEQLLEAAERRAESSTDLHGFTSVIKNGFDHDERVALMEMLWQVILADGRVHDYEASLMRRVAGLLYVQDGDSADARQRALLSLQPT